eukprot:TRINITY_DN13172_c0_g1_i1.p1 TRINITY_DN13172_c0_g1~~TRINITY_DN13172_c0_g1_i1.p1  ORF type:complete len:410 (+),score=110.33 TRINITY_DN13172_c0_g1_i1:63-1232(+)
MDPSPPPGPERSEGALLLDATVPPHRPWRPLQGRYRRLLLPHLHAIVERWYNTDASAKQKRQFKQVFTAIWGARSGAAAAAAADGQPRPAEAPSSGKQGLLLWKVYMRGVICPEHRAAAERWAAAAGPQGVEGCRSVFSAIRQRSEKATVYRRFYRPYDADDRGEMKQHSMPAADVHLRTWERFRLHNPNRVRKPPDADAGIWGVVPSERPAEEDTGDFVVHGAFLGARGPPSPPFAHFFGPKDLPFTTETQDSFRVNLVKRAAPVAVPRPPKTAYATASAGARIPRTEAADPALTWPPPPYSSVQVPRRPASAAGPARPARGGAATPRPHSALAGAAQPAWSGSAADAAPGSGGLGVQGRTVGQVAGGTPRRRPQSARPHRPCAPEAP